jgi:hypothetical protein
MFQQAKGWNCRPSQLADISDPYRAFCFDEAVSTWGNHVTNELEKIEGKNSKEVEKKRRNKLLQLLDAPAKQRFRSMRPRGS